jgi:hypothetical protein
MRASLPRLLADNDKRTAVLKVVYERVTTRCDRIRHLVGRVDSIMAVHGGKRACFRTRKAEKWQGP